MPSLTYVGGETDLHRDVPLHHHLGQAGVRPDPGVLHCWGRGEVRGVATPAIKNQLVASKDPTVYWNEMTQQLISCSRLVTGSLWHKGAKKRSFPCMEANYPFAIKNQRGASKIILVGDELVLYGIRLLASQGKFSTKERRWLSCGDVYL